MRKCDDQVGVTIRETLDAYVRGHAAVRVLGWRSGCDGIIGVGFLAAVSIDENEALWCDSVRRQRDWRRTLVKEKAVDHARRVVTFASFAAKWVGSARGDKTIEISQLAKPRTTGKLGAFYVHPDLWAPASADELMKAALDALIAGGVMRSLWVPAGNGRARRLRRARRRARGRNDALVRRRWRTGRSR